MKNVYLLIGTQKAGTTSIYTIFKHHEYINCAKPKETKFFLRDSLYQQGLDFYESQFFDAEKKEKPYLDVDPEFIYYDFIPQRIYQSLGDEVKFIAILRDPVDRAYSQYLMAKARGHESLSFIEAVQAESQRVETESGNYHNAYVHRGFYYKQLQNYLKYFSKDKFRIFLFEEDFVDNKKQMISDLCDFMNIPFPDVDIHVKVNYSMKIKNNFIDKIYHGAQKPSQRIANLVINNLPTMLKKKVTPFYQAVGQKIKKIYINANTSKDNIAPLDAKVRQWLIQEYFKDDIEQLEELIQRDLAAWKQ